MPPAALFRGVIAHVSVTLDDGVDASRPFAGKLTKHGARVVKSSSPTVSRISSFAGPPPRRRAFPRARATPKRPLKLFLRVGSPRASVRARWWTKMITECEDWNASARRRRRRCRDGRASTRARFEGRPRRKSAWASVRERLNPWSCRGTIRTREGWRRPCGRRVRRRRR